MDAADEVFEEGLAHQARGDFAGAEALHRRVLAMAPDHAGSTHCLGLIAAQQGRFSEALPLLRRAVELVPENASYRANLGAVLFSAGRLKRAVACCRAALRLDPGHAVARGNLGRALLRLGEMDAAARQLERALESGDRRTATWLDLGAALEALGRSAEAIPVYEKAVAARPRAVAVHGRLGNALKDLGRLDEAADAFRRGLAVKPRAARLHHNLGLTLLMMGRIAEGAAEYEWRFRLKAPTPFDAAGRPRWDGAPAPDGVILLHAEQGFGDAIQFVRYAPLVRAVCAQVVLVCRPPLARLFASAPGVDRVVRRGEPEPEFSAHAPLMSLMHIFGTTLETVPAGIPYLAAEPELKDAMAARLAGGAEMKVGLVWAGSPRHPNDRNRSIDVERLAPLLAINGLRFFSLQTGERAADLARLPSGEVVDLAPHLSDFADTAAAISGLDLVISVDTATAHLAGAMGRPVWTLLPDPPDWRWMLGRDDTPWYPTMRLFRQKEKGAWGPVVDRLCEALWTRIAERERMGAGT